MKLILIRFVPRFLFSRLYDLRFVQFLWVRMVKWFLYFDEDVGRCLQTTVAGAVAQGLLMVYMIIVISTRNNPFAQYL